MKNFLLAALILVSAIKLQAQTNAATIQTNADGSTQTQIQQVVNQFNTENKSVMWSAAEKVSDYVNEDSRDMGIAMGPDSTIHVVYCDDVPGLPSVSRQRITYKSKPKNGVWSTALIIDEFSGVPARNNHEASIAVSNNGDVHVTYHYWAYDGTGLNQIGYSKYEKATDSWSTELISGSAGTVSSTYSNYPRLTSTNSNIPVVTWGTDNTSGYDEAYFTYNNGTIWMSPILLSSADTNKAQYPRAISLGDEKVFLLFREYDIPRDSLAMYYRVLDVSNGSLTSIRKIEGSERISTSNYDYYYGYDACFTSDNKVFIALNVDNIISGYTYDLNTDTVIQSSHTLTTSYSANTDYNILSVCADDLNKVHIAYTVWNDMDVRYVTYDEANGFSGYTYLTTGGFCIDKPQIIFGTDRKLHIVYPDDSEDTNSDGYIDREVYYLEADFATGTTNKQSIGSKLKIYPNPSNGIYNIDTDIPSEITITNINGEVVYKNNSINRIDISNQANGIYFLNINNKKGNYFSKLVKH